MFFGHDLNQLFSFPFKDADSRKHFLVGCVVSLTAFIVPIIPYFILYGYGARIAKQILNNEAPHMIPWDDWGGMFKDGAKMFGVRIIYSIPILIFVIPLFLLGVAVPFFAESLNNSNAEGLIIVFVFFILGTMCLILPISLAINVTVPAPEMHALEKDDFAAGFRFAEWWQIFRANISGFIAAFGIYYFSTMILMFAIQIVYITLILACLIPFLLPATTLYLVLVMYAASAQAYKDGHNKLATT